MAQVFNSIPDWFSIENQGGGVAIADISGTGHQDLIVFMIDNPLGQNRGLFRVGRKLDAANNVTDGYTPWIDIHGKFVLPPPHHKQPAQEFFVILR